jgi:arsenate reductase
MNEAGVDIAGQRAKGIEAIPMETVDLLITLCGEAEEACPALAAQVERQHWPLPDPALARGDEAQILRVFREVRDAIRARVEHLLTHACA